MVFIIITLTHICGLDGFMHVRILASIARPIGCAWLFRSYIDMRVF
jgi:hypothetical protein